MPRTLEARNFRRDFGRFIAAETGTDFVPAVLAFDPPTQELPEKVALSLGDLGRMPHPVAMQEADAHARAIAQRPDIDPETDLRGALFQRLARSAKFLPAEADPLERFAYVCIATAKRR